MTKVPVITTAPTSQCFSAQPPTAARRSITPTPHLAARRSITPTPCFAPVVTTSIEHRQHTIAAPPVPVNAVRTIGRPTLGNGITFSGTAAQKLPVAANLGGRAVEGTGLAAVNAQSKRAPVVSTAVPRPAPASGLTSAPVRRSRSLESLPTCERNFVQARLAAPGSLQIEGPRVVERPNAAVGIQRQPLQALQALPLARIVYPVPRTSVEESEAELRNFSAERSRSVSPSRQSPYDVASYDRSVAWDEPPTTLIIQSLPRSGRAEPTTLRQSRSRSISPNQMCPLSADRILRGSDAIDRALSAPPVPVSTDAPPLAPPLSPFQFAPTRPASPAPGQTEVPYRDPALAPLEAHCVPPRSASPVAPPQSRSSVVLHTRAPPLAPPVSPRSLNNLRVPSPAPSLHPPDHCRATPPPWMSPPAPSVSPWELENLQVSSPAPPLAPPPPSVPPQVLDVPPPMPPLAPYLSLSSPWTLEDLHMSSPAPPLTPALPHPAPFPHQSPVGNMELAGIPNVAGEPLVENITKDIAVREVELRALRAEVEHKDQESISLKEKIKETEFSILEASGNMETVSAKMEVKCDNQQAILHASAKRSESHVVTLQRKLAQMEWDLHEKEEEVAHHLRKVKHAEALLFRQQNELGIVKQSNEEQGHQMALLAMDADRLQRTKTMGEWQERAKAKIEQENADVALVRERRTQTEELRVLEEEISMCRAFIVRMEDRCDRQVVELDRQRRRYDALQMERRLCETAAGLGREAAGEELQHKLAEHQALESRIHHEATKKEMNGPSAHRYAALEMDALSNQDELWALTACMREMSRELHTGPGGPDDAVDAAMTAFLQAARHLGETIPPVIRIGPSDYLIGHELVQCALIDGRLNVRLPGGLMVGIGDFLHKHSSFKRAQTGEHTLGRSSLFGLSSPVGCRRGRDTLDGPSQAAALAANHARAAARSRSATPPPHPNANSTALAAGHSWGMPALVAPMTIGGPV